MLRSISLALLVLGCSKSGSEHLGPDQIQSHKRAVLASRDLKDSVFRSADSPLAPDQIKHFTGLSYFDYDNRLVFRVHIEPVDEETVVQMATSKGKPRRYKLVGRISFDHMNKNNQLSVFTSIDRPSSSVFVPFKDKTSGVTTYGAGRYLDLIEENDGSLILDFNEAYNPFCAYSEDFSCPLPPASNWLAVPIEAGESYSAHLE